MLQENILTYPDITNLSANIDITITIDTPNQSRGMILENITQFYFGMYNENGVLLYLIEPWQRVTDYIHPNESFRTLKSMVSSKPQQPISSASSSTWAITLDLTTVDLTYSQTPLNVSNASNVATSLNYTRITGTVANLVIPSTVIASGTPTFSGFVYAGNSMDVTNAKKVIIWFDVTNETGFQNDVGGYYAGITMSFQLSKDNVNWTVPTLASNISMNGLFEVDSTMNNGQWAVMLNGAQYLRGIGMLYNGTTGSVTLSCDVAITMEILE